MDEQKELFVKELKNRTRKFAGDIILYCNTLVDRKASSVITYQLIKSATSTGANYRAACRARSKSEFYSKICIVVEEIDESVYWLEIIDDVNLSKDKKELKRLLKEAVELTKIMTSIKNNLYKK